MKITTIGIDLAKNVFAIHGVDELGNVVVKRTLRRSQVLPFFRKLEPCLIGMEACGSAHYWARKLIDLGHEVKLMPPSYVKPYIKRGKSDEIDAEGCCEAVGRPNMHFVPVKSEEQQSIVALHRARYLLMRQKTQTANSIRSLCAEFGVVAPKGRVSLRDLFRTITNENDTGLPAGARLALSPLVYQFEQLLQGIAVLDKQIIAHARSDENCRRLDEIAGIGCITASAVVAKAGDGSRFKTSRDLPAWIGLARQPNATGGKDKGGQFQSRVIVTCAGCSSRVRPRSSTARAIRAPKSQRHGCGRCWSANLARSPSWRRPTRQRKSPGPCLCGRKNTGPIMREPPHDARPD